jgi:phage recombination protein Bet
MNVVPFREAPAPMKARDYTASQLKLVRETVAKDCNATEFDLFVEIARRVGLDPFRRQIYAIVTNKDKADKRQMVTVTGIDGYRAIAARCADYRPDEDEPRITYDEALKNPDTNPLGIEKAEVIVHKRDASGKWHPIKGVAYWDEFAPVQEVWDYDPQSNKRKPTGKFALATGKDNWRKMARVMIAKCAEAQALRKGWPEDLSGVYVAEEMHQAEVIDVSPSEAIEREEIDRRRQLIGAKHSIPVMWAAGQPIEMVPHGQFADRVLQFLSEQDSPTAVEHWKDINAEGLRQFWAESKSDALELKKQIEARIQELANG